MYRSLDEVHSRWPRRGAVVQCLEPRLLFAGTAFTIDPTRSSIAIVGQLNGQIPVTATAQDAAGKSLVTTYHGMVFANAAGGAITFDAGSAITADINGNWKPGSNPGLTNPGNVDVSEPSDYGAQFEFFGTPFEFAAARAIAFDTSSGSIPLAADGTFDSNQITVKSTSGTVFFDGTQGGSVDLTGRAGSNEANMAGSYTVANGIATLTVPISATDSETVTADDGTTADVLLTFSGQIVATASVAPASVSSAAFDYQQAPQTISLTFSKPVSGINPGNLKVQNVAGGATITPKSVTYNANTRTAVFTLPAVPLDGNYEATLAPTGISDGSGMPFNGGNNYAFDFYYLPGDVNHDRKVDFTDLLALAQGYGRPGTFSQGDLNYDGKVDFTDLLLLAQNYGRSLPAPVTAAALRFG